MCVRIKTKISDVLMNEETAIGFALKSFIGSYPEQNDLLKPEFSKKDKNKLSLCSKCDKVKRVEQQLAERVGLKNKDAFHLRNTNLSCNLRKENHTCVLED